MNDNPPTPPALPRHHRQNFKMIRTAERAGDLALVSATRAADGEPVALVCAIQRNADKTFDFVPLAVMIDGNPFELYNDPTIV